MQGRFLNIALFFLLILTRFQGLAQPFSSSNLPIIVIDTRGAFIQDEPKVFVDMGIIDNGPGIRNEFTDPFNNFSGTVAIEVRGSSSQMFPKKQYGFEIVDENGMERDTTLLGLPSESDWILFAPYNDKSLMRDVLAYKLARDMARYAPRTKYCELVIDGQYEGIYVLIEKIKRDKNRVDINKLGPDENSGDDLTGGYIIKIDKQTADIDQGWMSEYPPPDRGSNQLTNFLYEYPDPRYITAAQRTYIRSFISDFEATLRSPDFADPLDGYARYIDVDSFVDFFIINELSKNVDGYRLSTYFHKQKNSDGGKLVMGPVWDFNLGFGNADYCTAGSPDGLVLEFNRICPNDWWLIPFWWEKLFRDVMFSKRVKARWNELRAGKYRTEKILAYVDSLSTSLSESQQRNFQRWPVLGTYVWPNYFVGNTFSEEVEWLKAWLDQRMQWLDIYLDGLVTANEIRGPQSSRIFPHPNPANSDFQFYFPIPQRGIVTIEIQDVLGRTVESTVKEYGEAGMILIRTGGGLARGNYYFRLKFNNQLLSVGKLVKN